MNVQRLLAVRDRILAEPELSIMDMFHARPDQDRGEHVPGTETRFQMVGHSCGTAHCIAGWAQVMYLEPDERSTVCHPFDEAAEILELSRAQATLLFYYCDWPLVHRANYVNAASDTERAQAMADMVDWFIEEEEEEEK